MKKINFLFFLLICVSIVPFVSSIRLTGSIHEFEFTPNYINNFSYACSGKPLMSVSISGDLEPYGKVYDSNPRSGEREFIVELDLPETLPRPGKWSLFVTAMELKATNSFISTTESVSYPIYVHVPYPGYYLDGSLRADKIDVNNDAKLILNLINRGQNNITDLKYKIKILDEYGESMDTIKDSYDDLFESQDNMDIPITIDSFSWTAGKYFIEAEVDYHKESIILNTTLLIGDLEPELVDFTPRTLLPERINEVGVVILPNWRTPQNVYAKILLDGKSKGITPTKKIGDFTSDRFLAYLDTTGFEEGEYEVTVEMFYGDESKTESVKVFIDKDAKSVEFEKTKSSDNTLLIFTIVSALVVLAALILMFYIVIKK
jgi:hypothetical protein